MCRFILYAYCLVLAKTIEAAKMQIDAMGDASFVRRDRRAEDVPHAEDDSEPCADDTDGPAVFPTTEPTAAPTTTPTSEPQPARTRIPCPEPLKCTCLKNAADEDSNRINWKLCDTDVEKGPGGMPIRYKNVADGIDMLLTASPGYEGRDTDKNNGRNGCLGQLNVKVPGSAAVTFALVKHGTDDVVPKGSTHEMTIFDTDKAKSGVTEKVGVSDYSSVDSVALNSTVEGGVAWFEAVHTEVENPTGGHTDDLTEAQLDASFSVTYRGKNMWVVRFVTEVPEGDDKERGGRNFFFSGRSCASATQHHCECPVKK